MNINLRVSLDFANYSDPDLDEFGGNIVVCLTGSTSFPTPPVTAVALGELVSDFHDAVLAALGGGRKLTVAKKAKRDLLLDALRKDATYVQGIASHNLDVLLSSGYYASSTNRAQSPLDPPYAQLDNLMSTKLLLRLSPITNARSYHVQTSVNGNGGWVDAGIYVQARRIVLGNLTPGTTYNVRARAIGGSSGSSDWSEPVSKMAT